MVWFSNIKKNKEEPEKEQEQAPLKRVAVDDAGVVYNEALVTVKEMQQRYAGKKELDTQGACALIERLVNNVLLGNDKILFLTTNNYREDWLCYHTVNITILAIKIGQHSKYPFDHLVYLGGLALLHEMGCPEGETRDLEGLEKQELIQQFIQGEQIKESFVKEALKIIAVLDVYESFTHERHYREKMAPYEVLKAIISAGEAVFNIEVVKEIIETFSVYPLGSFVRLNTEEVAQVVRINHDFPLRPEVVILTDSQGKKLKEKKAVDLSHKLNIFIKEPFSDEKPLLSSCALL